MAAHTLVNMSFGDESPVTSHESRVTPYQDAGFCCMFFIRCSSSSASEVRS